jgi:hypothetical protein
MDVEQPKKDFGKDDEPRSYIQYAVDLEDYVAFEGGRLKLYAFLIVY